MSYFGRGADHVIACWKRLSLWVLSSLSVATHPSASDRCSSCHTGSCVRSDQDRLLQRCPGRNHEATTEPASDGSQHCSPSTPANSEVRTHIVGDHKHLTLVACARSPHLQEIQDVHGKDDPEHDAIDQSFRRRKEQIYDKIKCYNGMFEKPVIASCYIGCDYVRICLAPDSCEKRSLSEHEESLKNSIQGFAVHVKQLTTLPYYKSTAQPGQFIRNGKTENSSISVLSLFVDESGDKQCALSVGHDKNEGDELWIELQANGQLDSQEQIGMVNLKIHEGDIQNGIPFCDVAVAELKCDQIVSNHVQTNESYCFHLDPSTEVVEDNQVQNIQLFVEDDVKKQRVKLEYYTQFIEPSHNLFDCVIIVSQGKIPIHSNGQSGVLITTSEEDKRKHVVKGLLILTGILSDEDGGKSVGQPLERTLERIKQHERYKNLSIKQIKNNYICSGLCQVHVVASHDE